MLDHPNKLFNLAHPWKKPKPPVPAFKMTPHFAPLFEFGKYRYKAFRGGRGSMKSQTIAKVLVTLAHSHHRPLLILCAREYQNSIADSVHRELRRQIDALGLSDWFLIEKATIYSKVTKSQFIFKGLHYGINEVKSMTGVDICWIEEAQSISKESLLVLDPTLREAGSEIWFSFNPDSELDPIYEFLVTNKPSNAYVCEVNWRDNPWFPDVLEQQRQRMLENDPGSYDWVWEGKTRKNTAATIFHGKTFVEDFDTPDDYRLRFFHGADWGFSQDPTCLIRCFILPVLDKDNKQIAEDLYIDREAFAYHLDLSLTGKLFDTIETARNWPIKADSSRPETISYMKGEGFHVEAAAKWQGSVEDGIEHLRAFRRIVIHKRCENMAMEARLYSFKTDQKTQQVLPIVMDAHNHGWDALRYSLDGLIQRRGGTGVWRKLAQQLQHSK